MLRLKLNHVSKRGYWWLWVLIILSIAIQLWMLLGTLAHVFYLFIYSFIYLFLFIYLFFFFGGWGLGGGGGVVNSIYLWFQDFTPPLAAKNSMLVYEYFAAASQAEATLEHSCQLTWILTWVLLLSDPGLYSNSAAIWIWSPLYVWGHTYSSH